MATLKHPQWTGKHPDYQTRALEVRGRDRTFTDCCSGHVKSRPEVDAGFAFLREGGTLAVRKFDRLARSLPNLAALADELERRHCDVAR